MQTQDCLAAADCSAATQNELLVFLWAAAVVTQDCSAATRTELLASLQAAEAVRKTLLFLVLC